MTKHLVQLRALIKGMRKAYANGENAMAFARSRLDGDLGSEDGNAVSATLIAYDLQTGDYTQQARLDPKLLHNLCNQVSQCIRTVLPEGGSILEVGVGEATTLAGVVQILGEDIGSAYGFDISWSRVDEGGKWLIETGQKAELFVADLFNIPLLDSSIDVVYSSHSLEPNGGREEEAIAECLRVARHGVVLIEPAYEFANAEARARMDSHGYVRGLREAAERLGSIVVEHRLLENTANQLNPSGVLILAKPNSKTKCSDNSHLWKCPLTGATLIPSDDIFYASEVGIAYPILRGVPLLREEHAVVASKCK